MDQEHRDKIINNIDKLIQYTSYEKLMDACINNQLLYASMQETIEAVIVYFITLTLVHFIFSCSSFWSPINSIQQKFPTQNERHKQLIEKITHRGPDAYAAFENILKQSFPDAAEILTHTSYRNVPFMREISIRENRQRIMGDIDRSPTYEPINIANFISSTNGIAANEAVPSPCPAAGECIIASSIITVNTAATISIAAGTATEEEEEEQEELPHTSQSFRSGYKPHRCGDIAEFVGKVQSNMKIDLKLADREHGDPTAKIGTYPMNGRHRGVFVLVNNIHFNRKNPRKGAGADRDNLVALFRQMGFTILLYEDLYKNVRPFLFLFHFGVCVNSSLMIFFKF